MVAATARATGMLYSDAVVHLLEINLDYEHIPSSSNSIVQLMKKNVYSY